MPDNEQGQSQDLFFEPVNPDSIWQSNSGEGNEPQPQGTQQGQPAPVPTSPSQDPLWEAQRQADGGQQADLANPQNAPQGDEPSLESKPVPEHMTPQQVYDMARYHQSRADQTRAEAEQLKHEIEALKSANPIGQYAVQDPKFMAMISQYLAGGGEVPQGTNGQSAQTLQKPQPPQRPANLEPYSEEAEKYQQEYANYIAQLGEYQQNLLESRLGAIEQYEQQQKQVVQQQQQYQAMMQEAMYTYQMPQQEAESFLRWAQQPERLNDMGLWLQAYKLDRARQGGGQVPQQRPVANGQQTPVTNVVRNQAIDHRQQRPGVPATAAAQPNASGAVETADPFFVNKQNTNPIW